MFRLHDDPGNVGPGIDGSWFTSVTTFARDTKWLNAPIEAFTNAGLVVFALLMVVGSPHPSRWWRRSPSQAGIVLLGSVSGGLGSVTSTRCFEAVVGALGHEGVSMRMARAR